MHWGGHLHPAFLKFVSFFSKKQCTVVKLSFIKVHSYPKPDDIMSVWVAKNIVFCCYLLVLKLIGSTGGKMGILGVKWVGSEIWMSFAKISF